ncbi:hypothetical protein C8R43DRAFT_947050 [Mycena crocata]|nr:hypothetical protein C8R43DRAFT_947050 [Mycena crocata]
MHVAKFMFIRHLQRPSKDAPCAFWITHHSTSVRIKTNTDNVGGPTHIFLLLHAVSDALWYTHFKSQLFLSVGDALPYLLWNLGQWWPWNPKSIKCHCAGKAATAIHSNTTNRRKGLRKRLKLQPLLGFKKNIVSFNLDAETHRAQSRSSLTQACNASIHPENIKVGIPIDTVFHGLGKSCASLLQVFSYVATGRDLLCVRPANLWARKHAYCKAPGCSLLDEVL